MPFDKLAVLHHTESRAAELVTLAQRLALPSAHASPDGAAGMVEIGSCGRLYDKQQIIGPL